MHLPELRRRPRNCRVSGEYPRFGVRMRFAHPGSGADNPGGSVNLNLAVDPWRRTPLSGPRRRRPFLTIDSDAPRVVEATAARTVGYRPLVRQLPASGSRVFDAHFDAHWGDNRRHAMTARVTKNADTTG